MSKNSTEPFFSFETEQVCCNTDKSRIQQLANGLNGLHDLFFEQIDLLGTRASDSAERVVTVRMSQQLHESLKAQAHELGMSLNQLCIARLATAARVAVQRKR